MQVIFLFGQNNFLLPAFFWSQNLYWGGKCKVGNRPASIMRIRHGLGKKRKRKQLFKYVKCIFVDRNSLAVFGWIFFWHLIIPRLGEHCFVARSFYRLCQLLNKLIFLKQKKRKYFWIHLSPAFITFPQCLFLSLLLWDSVFCPQTPKKCIPATNFHCAYLHHALFPCSLTAAVQSKHQHVSYPTISPCVSLL